MQTIVGREQSNLINNTICCYTDHYRKRALKRLFVRATGHKTPGESSVILQIVVMVQLTSRRILRD